MRKGAAFEIPAAMMKEREYSISPNAPTPATHLSAGHPRRIGETPTRNSG